MDMDMYEKDLREAVKKMPPELLKVLTDLAKSFGPTLERIVPDLMEGPMKLHILAAMSEGMMGVLDKSELERVTMKVLTDAQAAG